MSLSQNESRRIGDVARAQALRFKALLPRRSDWAHVNLRRDLTAGLMVGLVAMPLALGFGVSSGMGAQAGLVSAVIAGAVAAIFGGSRVQVSGPTGAMTVVLVPIIAQYGAHGVLMVGLLAGLMLIGLGITGAGRSIRYIPLPVVEGFTVGIALIIALQQVPAALGMPTDGHKVAVGAVRAVMGWITAPQPTPAAITALVIMGILVLSRLYPTLPGSLIAVLVATAAAQWLNLDVAVIGQLPTGFPVPSMPTVPLDELQQLVLPAVAVAALAALESLLSATVADGMSIGERHDPDRELFGQGLANLAVPLFGGIPATAAIARTAVNIRSGASSRLAAVVHAGVLLIAMVAAARWVGMIPLSALAGVLIATAIKMVRVSSLRPLLHASSGDAAVLVLTTIATVAFDLVTAVIVGMIVAGVIALRRTALSARLDRVPLGEPETGSDQAAEERKLLDEKIVAYRLEGPLFFAAAHDFLLELTEVSNVRVVVLRMSRVTVLDVTGAVVLGDIITSLENRHVTVLMSGVRPEHLQVLSRLGVPERLAHERHLFATTPEAIAHARVHAARIAHSPLSVPPTQG